MTSILWLRRDLRLHEHPALQAARAEKDGMVPVFCFDDGLLTGRHASGPRTQFMLECLAELDAGLRDRGSRLFVRHGPPVRELVQLARDTGADTIHVSADVGPFARRRDAAVKQALAEIDVEFVAHPGLFAVDALEPLRTGAGRPYTVFTPFYKKWVTEPRRDIAAAPRTLPGPPSGAPAAGKLPTLASLGLEQEVPEPAPGGEQAGRDALHRFLRGPVDDYADGHNTLTGKSISRLSPYLHFGCLSPREIESELGRSEGAQAFHRQICWRDFYAHVLGHFPRNRPLGVPGALPGHAEVEPRREALRGLVRGPHRLPRGRRRHAPAASRGLAAQPRPARRRVVSDQGHGNRLALGRALVHAAAARRRRGLQQRQLAVDRLGRRRSRSGVSADVQPHPAAEEVRSRWRLRPRVRARTARGARRLPGRAVDDAR